MSGPILLGALVFLVLVPWGESLTRWLLAHGIGKRIRLDGPEAHQVKAGTATMGGLYFVVPGVIVGIILVVLGYRQVWGPLLAVAAYGALGAFDDLQGLRDREGVGWLARHKFPWQWGVGFLLAAAMYWFGGAGLLILPFSGSGIDLGGWFIPIGAFFLVASVNAVNLTDGLDGLAGGTAAIVLGLYGLLAIVSGMSGLSYWIWALIGALLAFLWYNVRPAQFFMGDVGAEALGGALAAVALTSGHWLLLPVAGVIFFSEALSVMMQVSYFKYTKRTRGEGQRIFRMTPLHHHFEQGGWPEIKITLRFWIVTLIASLLAWGLAGTHPL